MSNLQKSLYGKASNRPPRRSLKEGNFAPVDWSEYFDQKEFIQINNNKFNVYLSGPDGGEESVPVVYFLHGGGFSGLSWAVFSKKLSELMRCRVIAPDLRGHGDTCTAADMNLSKERQCQDVADIFYSLYPKSKDDNGNKPPPHLVLVGHSMGGAIASHVAKGNYIEELGTVVVIDVVEGTAMAALPMMRNILRARPKGFVSVEAAIEWSYRNGHIRSLESARVSMPGQISIINESDNIKSSNIDSNEDCGGSVKHMGMILEALDEEIDNIQFENVQNNNEVRSTLMNKLKKETPLQYKWRIDLNKSEQFWKGWFTGMDDAFMTCKQNKLLFVAGLDRLDKDLIVGQMQGKFQIGVLPSAGHAVHEDKPERVAKILADFLVRYKICDLLPTEHKGGGGFGNGL